MPAASVNCSKCKSPLPANLFNLPEPAGCPGCGSLTEVEVFPALYRTIAPGQQAEAVLEDSESACFYHPEKKAVLPCDACGRFLCALCDCELDGRHYCPSCLNTGKRKGKIVSLENQRTCYDTFALQLAVWPLLFAAVTCITAPIALVIAIWKWNAPISIVRRSKIRLVLAIIFASLEIVGWVVGIIYASLNNS